GNRKVSLRLRQVVDREHAKAPHIDRPALADNVFPPARSWIRSRRCHVTGRGDSAEHGDDGSVGIADELVANTVWVGRRLTFGQQCHSGSHWSSSARPVIS